MCLDGNGEKWTYEGKVPKPVVMLLQTIRYSRFGVGKGPVGSEKRNTAEAKVSDSRSSREVSDAKMSETKKPEATSDAKIPDARNSREEKARTWSAPVELKGIKKVLQFDPEIKVGDLKKIALKELAAEESNEYSLCYDSSDCCRVWLTTQRAWTKDHRFPIRSNSSRFPKRFEGRRLTAPEGIGATQGRKEARERLTTDTQVGVSHW